MTRHLTGQNFLGVPDGQQPSLHLESPTPGQEQTISYIPVCTGMYWYVRVLAALHVLVYRYIPECIKQVFSEHCVYTSIYCIKELVVFHSGVIDFRSIHGGIHFPRTAQHIMCFKRKIIHFLASCVRTMYIHVHTGICCYVRIHTNITTTFHFESGLIRLATPTIFPSTLEPFIACSILPLHSILHCQTTLAGLAAPKLPQPGVNLIDIAAPPSICCRCVGATEREAGILALAELVRDGRN